jgi:acetyltransferase-like isoleucine patch superfamily enzyme
MIPHPRSVLQRLETEYSLWRHEPIRRVAVRNKVLRPLRTRQFAAFGPRSFIDRPAWLYGTSHISIGAGVIVLEGAWLAVEKPAWHREEPVLVIGDRVAIRTGCTISAADSIVIEAHVGMGGGVTIIDSKHSWAEGNPNVLDGPIDTAPIRIGQGTWLADRVTVAAGADIGMECAIGPNSVVSSMVPDYSIVMGNPGRVVGSTRS